MTDYARRPAIAGKNFQRLSKATLRSSIRRKDADGTSASPYYPITAGQTLQVALSGASIIVTFTSKVYNTILSELNTQLAPHATARDEGGYLLLEASLSGGDSLVQIVGGTASVALGFDTATGDFSSVAGDLKSTPGGALGNPQGTLFPDKGETLRMENLQRALAGLSGNGDILNSEHAQKQVSLRDVVDYTYTSDRKGIVLDSSITAYVGDLSSSSSADDIARYFQVYDPLTGKPYFLHVVAVGIGANVTTNALPLVNATTTGGSGNVLGQSLTRTTAVITSIKDGRYLKCDAANFISAGVLPGEFVEVSGATNLAPFSNNGYRWVVESVKSSTVLEVRPMSKTELNLLGSSSGAIINELNDQLSGGQVYGSITVRTGPLVNGVTLRLNGAIPAGDNVRVVVAQPSSLREGVFHEIGVAEGQSLLPHPSEVDNAVLYGLDVGGVGNSFLSISRGDVRSGGKVLRIPPTEISTVGVTGTLYVSFHYGDGNFRTASDPLGHSPGWNEVFAKATVLGGSVTAIENFQRVGVAAPELITVGNTGQFFYLDEAARYVNMQGFNAPNAAEIVLVSTVTHLDPVVFTTPVILRGASPDIQLHLTAPIHVKASSFRMQDLKVRRTGPSAIPIVTTESSTGDAYNSSEHALEPRFELVNVRHIIATTDFTYVLGPPASGTPLRIPRLFIERCHFNLSSGIARVRGWTSDSGSGSEILLRTSSFNFKAGSAVEFLAGANAGTSTHDRIEVQGCSFTGFNKGLSATAPFLIAGSGNTVLLVKDNVFTPGTLTAGDNNPLITSAGTHTVIESNRLLGGLVRVIVAGQSKVLNNHFIVSTHNQASLTAVLCFIASGNHIQVVTGTNTATVALQVGHAADNNVITGRFESGIFLSTITATASNNQVSLTTTVTTGYGISGGGLASGNDISVPSTGISGTFRVVDNRITLIAANATGILTNGDGYVLSGNNIFGTLAGQVAFRINGQDPNDDVQVSDCTVKLQAADSKAFLFSTTEPIRLFTVTGCRLDSGSFEYWGGQFTHNDFNGLAVGTVVTFRSIGANIQSNTFSSSSVTFAADSSGCSIVANIISGNLTVSSCSSISSNVFTGMVTVSGAGSVDGNLFNYEDEEEVTGHSFTNCGVFSGNGFNIAKLYLQSLLTSGNNFSGGVTLGPGFGGVGTTFASNFMHGSLVLEGTVQANFRIWSNQINENFITGDNPGESSYRIDAQGNNIEGLTALYASWIDFQSNYCWGNVHIQYDDNGAAAPEKSLHASNNIFLSANTFLGNMPMVINGNHFKSAITTIDQQMPDTGTLSTWLTFSGNHSEQSSIIIRNARGATITGNNLYNNSVGTTDAALILQRVKYSTVSGNHLLSNATQAMLVTSFSFGSLSNDKSSHLVISGNHITSHVLSVAVGALKVDAALKTNITGNFIARTGGVAGMYGVHVNSGSDITYLSDNFYTGHGASNFIPLRNDGTNTYASKDSPLIVTSGSNYYANADIGGLTVD